MLLWIILAVLVIVPLLVQLRGGGIVALSTSVTALYSSAATLSLVLKILPIDTAANILNLFALGHDVEDLGAFDPALVHAYLQAAYLPTLIFAGVAVVFWGLRRINAPVPDEPLKNLFWMLHTAILAMPFATLIFIRAGIPSSYFDGSTGVTVFAFASMIVTVLIAIALVGLCWIAATSVFKRGRP